MQTRISQKKHTEPGFEGTLSGKSGRIKTLRKLIYYYVRDGIIRQEFLPNQRIQEKEIAREFGVSTTPVREAFLKLEAEGYLDIDEHRRVNIRPISHSELIEIYQVMSVLDGFAAFLALQKIDDSGVREIQKLTKKMESFCKKDMVEEYLEMNTLIHSTIWKITDNKNLRNMLENTQNQMLRYQAERLSFYSKPGVMKRSMVSHRKIAKAFQASDFKKIESVVRNHWNISGILDQ
jgi:DNA-binding GntR family transcriptional regulator